MLWEEYYDKLSDWATGTAVSRISRLESFGPPHEIIDAINQIGFEDEKGAARLLKKAIAAGVKFSGDQLSELFLICEETAITQAIQASSDRFRTEDLEALNGFADEETLVHIADKQRIRLPECLADCAEAPEEPEEEREAALASEALAAGYDEILGCLYHAHSLLKKAYGFSLTAANSKARAETVAKYACIADAQAYIAAALKIWNLLDLPPQVKQSLGGIWPNISNGAMWHDYLTAGFFANLAVKRELRKVLGNIETAVYRIQKMRNEL